MVGAQGAPIQTFDACCAWHAPRFAEPIDLRVSAPPRATNPFALRGNQPGCLIGSQAAKQPQQIRRRRRPMTREKPEAAKNARRTVWLAPKLTVIPLDDAKANLGIFAEHTTTS